jgi:hypothetical protein
MAIGVFRNADAAPSLGRRFVQVASYRGMVPAGQNLFPRIFIGAGKMPNST